MHFPCTMREMAPKRSLAYLVEELEGISKEKAELKREYQRVFDEVTSQNKRIKALKDEILTELNQIGEESIEVGNSVVSLKRTVKENHDARLLQEKMDAEKFNEYTEAVSELKESVQLKPRKKKKGATV